MFEDLGEEEELAEEEPTPEAPKRRGRPPKKQPPAPIGDPVPPLTPSLASREPETHEQRLERLGKWRKDCPRIIGEAWLWCLEHAHEMGWEARDFLIGITDTRPAGGGDPVLLPPKIRGDQVQGTPENSADESLIDWIADCYHQDLGQNSPRTYKARIQGPNNSHVVETEPFRLEPYTSIMQRRRFLRMRTEQMGAGFRTPHEPPPHPVHISPAVAPAAPHMAGVPYEVALELGALREANARSRAEGRPAEPVAPVAPVAAPPQPPGVSKEEIASLVAQTVAGALAAAGIKPKNESDAVAEAVAAALAAHGIKPKTETEAQAERDTKLLASVSALIEARLGPSPVGAGSIPSPNAPPPTITDLIQEAARKKLEVEETIAQAKKVLGVQDPPPTAAEIVPAPRDEDEDEGVLKKAFNTVVAGVAQDPLGALGGLAAFVHPFVEGSAVGTLIAKGAAGAAEAARQQQIRNSVQMPGTAPRKGPSV